jgi:DinB family protein
VLPADEITAILRQTPERITELTKGLTSKQLHTPALGRWSINDHLAHLRACQDVFGGAMVRIVREEHPSFTAINPHTWIKQTDYPEWKFRRALGAFTKQRADLLKTVGGLPARSWRRTAKVKVWAASYERTAHYYGDWMASHERAHWKSIKRIADAVR